jgi:hypothetical protein
MAKADLGNIPERAEEAIEDYMYVSYPELKPKKKRKRKT